MSTTDTDLILHIIIYGLVKEVTNPTKAVQDLYKKLKHKLIHIYKTKPAYFIQVEQIKKDLYSKSWYSSFGSVDAGETLSIGTIIDVLYIRIDKPLVGNKVMEKASTSFFMNKEPDPETTAAVESVSNKLAYTILDNLGFKISSLSSMKSTIYNTLALEGKL